MERGRATTRRRNRRAVPGRLLVATIGVTGLAVLAGACSDDGDSSSSDTTAAAPTTETTVVETTTTTAPEPALVEITPSTTAPPDTAPVDPTAPTTEAPAPARVFELDWSKLTLPTYFELDDETNPDDPFWYIHNQPDEGFFLSLEMYTTGFGSAWTGETGTFDLSCTEGGTGICIHFDPDGPGEDEVDLNVDFAATGTIEITTLDESDGYDLVLTGVTFSDGTTIPGPTRLTGP